MAMTQPHLQPHPNPHAAPTAVATATTARDRFHRWRQHRMVLEHADRRALERAGWRTVLDYRENHVRGVDGVLVRVTPSWTAEAEWCSGAMVASATAATAEEAWTLLRQTVEDRGLSPAAPGGRASSGR